MPIEPSEDAVACTLGAGDFAARVAWIADLNRRALRSQRRVDLTLELTYARGARDDVLQMVRSEQACCGFLGFEVREETDAIKVVIQAPERAREAADKVFEPFLSKAPVGAGCSCCRAA
jgi:hypothetical protein